MGEVVKSRSKLHRAPSITTRITAAAVALGALSACGEDVGTGDVTFSVYGEDFIERGIDASEFADGWAVTFSKFLIGIGDISVADTNAVRGGRLTGSQVVDLVEPGPHELGQLVNLEARAWNDVSYSILPVDARTERHSSASPDDVALARQAGASIYVEGTAVKGSDVKTFAWAFTHGTRYTECVQVDGRRVTPGIVVTNGGTEAVELTIHGDHLFYDDLVSEDAVLRFEPIAAADADSDGDVTLEELAAVPLVSIPEGTYGTGNADIDDLGAFVRALTTSLGHFRGEGHCTSSAL